MMISPEAYVEGTLQGQPPAVLLQRVNAPRREIARLKRKMEHPFYTPLGDPLSSPKQKTQKSPQTIKGAKWVCSTPGAGEAPSLRLS